MNAIMTALHEPQLWTLVSGDDLGVPLCVRHPNGVRLAVQASFHAKAGHAHWFLHLYDRSETFQKDQNFLAIFARQRAVPVGGAVPAVDGSTFADLVSDAIHVMGADAQAAFDQLLMEIQCWAMGILDHGPEMRLLRMKGCVRMGSCTKFCVPLPPALLERLNALSHVLVPKGTTRKMTREASIQVVLPISFHARMELQAALLDGTP